MKADDIKKYEKINNVSLPKCEDVEKGIVGTLMLHPEFVLKSDNIKPKFFYNRSYACVYHVIYDLYNSGICEVDNFIISTKIDENKGYKKAISETTNDMDEWLSKIKLVGRNTIEEYTLLCETLISTSFKRDSYLTLQSMSKELLKSEDNINDANYRLQNSISDFSKIYICNSEIASLGEQVDKIWESVMSKRTSGFFGFPSVFEELNQYFSYEKTEVIGFSAPAKTSKSMIICNEIWHKVLNGVPSVIVDREMSTENHLLRFLSYLTGIPSRKIKTGDLSVNEDKLIDEKIKFIKTLPLYHMYKPATDMSDMYFDIRTLKLKHGIEMIGYDYIKANDGISAETETQRMGRLSDWLKNDICGSLDLAGITAMQSDRTGTKISDSAKVERNLSGIVMVKRKTMEEIVKDGRDAGDIRAHISHNRNGAMMTDCYYNMQLHGDIATIVQAKTPFSYEDEIPY